MIIERLKTIIRHYNLTPSAFADAIGVPRSSISHLLSGRNKPSMEFVLKLIKAYPEVNLYWFLNGKGTFPSQEETDLETTPAADKVTLAHTEGINEPNNPSKAIQKIVVLYEDGTFETYNPKT